MASVENILNSAIQWTQSDENIRVVILIGSHAHKSDPDRLAGIDLDIFARNPQQVVDANDWESQFGNPWLTKWTFDVDLFLWNAVYDDGLLLSLYIQPMSTLEAIQEDLPPYYLPRYQVLVDKDEQAANLPPGQVSQPQRPKPTIFLEVLQQFWLDAYYSVRYLWRGELWRAKHYDWQLKQHLLRMLCWHSSTCTGLQNINIQEGSHLSEWVDPETYADLAATFGHFPASDAWRALEETIQLFSRLAREVAPKVGITYPVEWEQKYKDLFNNLRMHSTF